MLQLVFSGKLQVGAQHKRMADCPERLGVASANHAYAIELTPEPSTFSNLVICFAAFTFVGNLKALPAE